MGTAAGAPFLPKLGQLAKGNLAFAVGLMVMLMVVTVGYLPLVLPLLLRSRLRGLCRGPLLSLIDAERCNYRKGSCASSTQGSGSSASAVRRQIWGAR